MTHRPPGQEVIVVCEGFVVREGGRVVDASSTVTLIKSRYGHIIVDTGSYAKLDLLKEELGRLSLAAEDVEMVVNTHLHNDHCGGNGLFTDAIAMAHGLEDPPLGTNKVSEGARLSEGVVVAETPGHTLGSIAVLVDADRKYAICGDAIPTKANYDTRTPPSIHVDRRLAAESMDRILAWADVVVPGHGAPFVTMGKK